MRGPGPARLGAAALAFAAALAAGPARAQEAVVARVKTVEGTAYALRGADRVSLVVGEPIRLKDVVETTQGSIGLTFRDGARLSIGPNSRLELKSFEYAPADGNLAFLVALARGTLVYISGLIGKLAPEKTQVETPVATVAVRGTRFLVKVED